MSKCNEAAAAIRKETRVDASLIVPIHLDLASLKNTAAFAEDFVKKETRLDALVLNAGISMGPFELTEDGVEKSGFSLFMCVYVYVYVYVYNVQLSGAF